MPDGLRGEEVVRYGVDRATRNNISRIWHCRITTYLSVRARSRWWRRETQGRDRGSEFELCLSDDRLEILQDQSAWMDIQDGRNAGYYQHSRNPGWARHQSAQSTTPAMQANIPHHVRTFLLIAPTNAWTNSPGLAWDMPSLVNEAAEDQNDIPLLSDVKC